MSQKNIVKINERKDVISIVLDEEPSNLEIMSVEIDRHTNGYTIVNIFGLSSADMIAISKVLNEPIVSNAWIALKNSNIILYREH